VQPLESVEEKVERELELELVVAARADDRALAMHGRAGASTLPSAV